MFGSVRNFRMARKSVPVKRAQRNARFHLQRVEAEIRVGSVFGSKSYTSTARVLLTDVADGELRFFSEDFLQEGTPIAITMDIPVRFFAKAKVRWCKDIPQTGRIICAHRYVYRICVELVFDSDEQRTEVLGYTENIRKDFVRAA